MLGQYVANKKGFVFWKIIHDYLSYLTSSTMSKNYLRKPGSARILINLSLQHFVLTLLLHVH